MRLAALTTDTTMPSKPLEILDVLGKDGVLSRRLPAFKARPQQVAMAEAVGATIEQGGTLLVEAPTGVGKSLAYLVPTLLSAIAKGRKVVISTHTLTLQDQLLDHDVPLLASCLPIEFTATKAVGRTNYLGLRRLHLALERAPTLVDTDPEVTALQRILAWAGTSEDGRRQELSPPPSSALWEQVQSEGDNCLGRRCPTFGQCFYQTARRRLMTSDIIVTNHALYFTDLLLRRQDMGLLPDHDVLILDEAHHVLGVAAEHFGLELSRYGIQRFVNRLAERRAQRGLLHQIPSELGKDALAYLGAVRGASVEFFENLASWCAEHPGARGRVREPSIVPDNLSRPLHALADALMELADTVERDEIRVELEAHAFRASALASTVLALLAADDPDLVYFVEGMESPRRLSFVARPLEVASILSSELFHRLHATVLTSATLASGGTDDSLAYPALQLGCPEASRLVLGSPFRYADQMVFHISDDLPEPDAPDFERAASARVLEYVELTGGGAFILFTSFRSLEGFHGRLARALSQKGLLVLRQGGDLDRAELLRRFRADGNAVLFGTESFWQGVDVPGPALRLVVLTRLPFPVPGLPMNEARSEALRRQGSNPFSSFFLPEAIVRFRQGFGRLLRTEEDEGLVVCLDRRIREKPYGRAFLAALPPCPVKSAAVGMLRRREDLDAKP